MDGRFPLALVQVHRRPPRDRHRSSSTANATGHRRLRAHHLRLRADVWHSGKLLVCSVLGLTRSTGCGAASTAPTRITTCSAIWTRGQTTAVFVLLRLPLCGVIYQPFDDGSDRLLRLSLDEVESICRAASGRSSPATSSHPPTICGIERRSAPTAADPRGRVAFHADRGRWSPSLDRGLHVPAEAFDVSPPRTE